MPGSMPALMWGYIIEMVAVSNVAPGIIIEVRRVVEVRSSVRATVTTVASAIAAVTTADTKAKATTAVTTVAATIAAAVAATTIAAALRACAAGHEAHCSNRHNRHKRSTN